MRRGDLETVTLTDLTLEGEGAAQVGGVEVRVPGAFPAERASVRIEHVSRQRPVVKARLLTLEEPHPARRQAPCSVHESRGGHCTGCAMMPLAEDAQRELKRSMLRSRFGLQVERVVHEGPPLGYRHSSKRIVFERRGMLSLGSFIRGTHTPAAMPDCAVDHPLLVQAFAQLENVANELGIVAYDERTGAGELRYVWAKTDGREVLITLVLAHEGGPSETTLPPRLSCAAGVAISIQPAASNALRGEGARLARGAAQLSMTLLDTQLVIGALGFLQPNPAVAALCYQALVDAPGGSRAALDLYAGAGVTTRLLRQRFAQVTPCEAHPESARALDVAPQSTAAFLRTLVDALPETPPDLVVANPPRKGMGGEVCALLSALDSPRVHVMSCGPEGLARDLAALAPRYELESLVAFDTLPQTPHVELVAKLVRRP